MKIPRKYGILFILFIFSACTTNTGQESFLKSGSKAVVVEGLTIGKEINLTGKNVASLTLNAQGNQISSFTAARFYSCNGNSFFLAPLKYCYYFSNLKLSLTLQKGKSVGILANSAHATADASQYFFINTTIAFSGTPYILVSPGIIWNGSEKVLTSEKPNEISTFLGEDGSSIKGESLVMDYNKNEFTLKNALVTFNKKEEL